MKRIIFLFLMLLLPFVVQSAVLPTDTINVGWTPHPQHSTTVSTNPPMAPITIKVYGRIVPAGTDIGSDLSGYLEWGEALGDGSFSIDGMTANYGEEIQVNVTACWDDPNVPGTDIYCVPTRSEGVAYVVPFVLENPTGIGISVSFSSP